MFVVTNEPTFTHTVTAMAPIDGGHEKQTFKVTYRVVDGDEFETFDLDTVQGSTDFLRRIVASLDELVDDKKQPVPYSDKVRDQVIRMPWARRAITHGYFDAINKAAEGN